MGRHLILLDSTANLIAHTVGGVAIIGHDTFDTVRCR